MHQCKIISLYMIHDVHPMAAAVDVSDAVRDGARPCSLWCRVPREIEALFQCCFAPPTACRSSARCNKSTCWMKWYSKNRTKETDCLYSCSCTAKTWIWNALELTTTWRCMESPSGTDLLRSWSWTVYLKLIDFTPFYISNADFQQAT